MRRGGQGAEAQGDGARDRERAAQGRRRRRRRRALDLLDLDGGGDPFGGSGGSAAPAATPKNPVLAPTQAGQGGQTGFGVMAAMVREGGQVKLMLTFSNSSQVPLSGFAIQVNKNPFGLGPAAALQVPDIAPGSSADSVLLMNPGTLSSGTAPTNPLFLQVAIKNSLDIFYFNVPFDLPVVLSESGALSREQFTQIWQGVGEARQSTTNVNVERPLSAEEARSRLASANINFVGQGQVDASTVLLYMSATASNGSQITAEVTVSSSNTSLKIATRTETPVLVPLFEAAVSKQLGLMR